MKKKFFLTLGFFQFFGPNFFGGIFMFYRLDLIEGR